MNQYLTPDEIDIVRKNGFDENGLRFSIEELQNVIPKDLSMDALSKYVDAITFAKVESGDSDFFKSQLRDLPVGAKIRISATGLGNLAYVALHMKDDDIRLKASGLFHEILSNCS